MRIMSTFEPASALSYSSVGHCLPFFNAILKLCLITIPHHSLGGERHTQGIDSTELTYLRQVTRLVKCVPETQVKSKTTPPSQRLLLSYPNSPAPLQSPPSNIPSQSTADCTALPRSFSESLQTLERL